MNTKVRMFLEEYGRLERNIEVRLEEIEQLRSLSTKITASYSVLPHASGTQSQIENGLVRLEEALDKLADSLHAFLDHRERIDELVTQLASEYRDLVTWRYVNHWSWDKIADGLNVSRSTAFNMHATALDNICKVLKN